MGSCLTYTGKVGEGLLRFLMQESGDHRQERPKHFHLGMDNSWKEVLHHNCLFITIFLFQENHVQWCLPFPVEVFLPTYGQAAVFHSVLIHTCNRLVLRPELGRNRYSLNCIQASLRLTMGDGGWGMSTS